MEKIFDFLKHPLTISVLVLTIGIGGIWGLIQAVPKTQVQKADKVERTWGKQDSKVTVVVYSDYQCPGCKYFWDNVEGELRTKYEDKVKFVYLHYPLSIHVKADDAAAAAEAAGEQGKFFEFSDILFREQPDQSNLASWTDDKFYSFARELGLDEGKFKESYKSGKYKELIKDYVREAEAAGVSSTPTVKINGQEVRGENNTIPDLTVMQTRIDAELAK